ncbi:MAG: hypothetical protein WCS43_02920 [Verrucomicrobiota bacterium]
MASDTANTHRDFWRKEAANVRLRVNFAWWLESLSAPLVILSLAGAATLLWMRREMPATPSWILPVCIGAAVVLLGAVCLVSALRKFENPEQSLVRIEAAMRLRNALTAAEAGVAPWPAPTVGKIDAGLRWQWPRLLVPLVGSLALLAAGLWLPVAARQSAAPTTPDQPQAWKQLSTELDHLTKEKVIDEKYLEETRKRIEELKAQKEDQWFSHSSLEATDTLKKAHRAEAERVKRELGRADKALGDLEKNSATAGQAEKARQMEEFQQALEGLQNGAMKPNPALLEQMKQMDLQNLADIPPEQLQQLRENLQKNAQGLKDAQGEGQGDDWNDELLAGEDGEGNGNGEGEGENSSDQSGDGNGKGGVSRGPGHNPNVLGKEKEGVKTGEMAGIQSKDLSKAAPGDLLELKDGEHQVDRSASKITSGGNTDATGKGGDRVWKEALDPDEQRVLKRYFE